MTNVLSSTFTGVMWAGFAAALVMFFAGAGIWLLLGKKYKKEKGYTDLKEHYSQKGGDKYTKWEYDWVQGGFWIMYFFLDLSLAALFISQVVPTNGENTFIFRTDTQIPFGFIQCSQGWADQGVCALWSFWIIGVVVIAFYSVLTAFFWDLSSVWTSSFLVLNVTQVMGLAVAASLGSQMTRIACYVFAGVATIGILVVGGIRMYLAVRGRHNTNLMKVDCYTNKGGYRAAVITTIVFNMIATIYFYIDFILSPAEVGEYSIQNQAIGRLIVYIVCYMAVPLGQSIVWVYRHIPAPERLRTSTTTTKETSML